VICCCSNLFLLSAAIHRIPNLPTSKSLRVSQFSSFLIAMSSPTPPTFSTLLLSLRDRVLWITLNRPARKNAFTNAMYNELIDAFTWAGSDPSVHVVVLTGSPDSKPSEFYSSGNDLGNFTGENQGSGDEMDLQKMTHAAAVMVERFVQSFIRFPKPLIGAVNGPAFGIAVTTLLLCDLVYTNTKASFTTPFTALGQNPEGCSSLLFPLLLGQKANRILLLGETLSAKDAERWNFTSGIYPDETFLKEVHAQASKLAAFPLHSVMASKQLVRRQQMKAMEAANKDESEVLEKLLNSPETMEAVVNRLMQMKKPKSKL
jgi:peroxisomal 3,2-trans-enoyl-CoA isomerase